MHLGARVGIAQVHEVREGDANQINGLRHKGLPQLARWQQNHHGLVFFQNSALLQGKQAREELTHPMVVIMGHVPGDEKGVLVDVVRGPGEAGGCVVVLR
jgi:hypothetical protein